MRQCPLTRADVYTLTSSSQRHLFFSPFCTPVGGSAARPFYYILLDMYIFFVAFSFKCFILDGMYTSQRTASPGRTDGRVKAGRYNNVHFDVPNNQFTRCADRQKRVVWVCHRRTMERRLQRVCGILTMATPRTRARMFPKQAIPSRSPSWRTLMAGLAASIRPWTKRRRRCERRGV